jgi:hypothetical protein
MFGIYQSMLPFLATYGKPDFLQLLPIKYLAELLAQENRF